MKFSMKTRKITMCIQSKIAQITRVAILGSLMFLSVAASANDLPCVQRAINWNKAAPPPQLINMVRFSMVALHSKGIAAFASGVVENSTCGAPWLVTATRGEKAVDDCLNSSEVNALLSDRLGIKRQPFDANNPLRLTIKAIPPDSIGKVRMQQPNATYDFHPQCVGDMLTGNDQWGNHWTISFQLDTAPRPPN